MFQAICSPGPEMLQTRSTRSTWGYWLSLLSSGPAEVPEGQMAAAMETAQQFLIDAETWLVRCGISRRELVKFGLARPETVVFFYALIITFVLAIVTFYRPIPRWQKTENLAARARNIVKKKMMICNSKLA